MLHLVPDQVAGSYMLRQSDVLHGESQNNRMLNNLSICVAITIAAIVQKSSTTSERCVSSSMCFDSRSDLSLAS